MTHLVQGAGKRVCSACGACGHGGGPGAEQAVLLPLLREGRKVPVGLRPSTGAEAKREGDTTGSHPCHKTLFSAEGGAPQLKSTACLQVSIGWSSGGKGKGSMDKGGEGK